MAAWLQSPSRLCAGAAVALAAVCANDARADGAVAAADAASDALRVAVAANFRAAFDAVGSGYPRALAPAYGSSGLLFAQIAQGRPFDVFLSADAARPQALVERGLATSPQRYAVGRLALLVNHGAPGPEWATSGKRIAVANPEAAPYGRAAVQALASLRLEPRRVVAMNVAQAFHFVASGAVDGAFVAFAQVLAENIAAERYWLVPEIHHEAIEQVAVVVRGGDEAGARAFLAFLADENARERIRAAGYR